MFLLQLGRNGLLRLTRDIGICKEDHGRAFCFLRGPFFRQHCLFRHVSPKTRNVLEHSACLASRSCRLFKNYSTTKETLRSDNDKFASGNINYLEFRINFKKLSSITLHDNFNQHNKLKETAGIHKKKKFSLIMDENGEIPKDNQEIMVIWERYITKLFSDERPSTEELIKQEQIDHLTGLAILREEIRRAIHNSKNNRKALGMDEVPAEIIKLFDEGGIAVLQRLFNKIYESGH